MCCNTNPSILSSTADTAVVSGALRITPTTPLNPYNEQGVKVLINTDTPTAGAALPVSIFFNSAAVPVYDKYGNLVYGNQIYRNQVLKGYFGNNGTSGDHFLLIKLPIRIYLGER